MRMIFTKSGGRNPARYDRLDCVTDAGPLPPIDCPKQGIIPHDMVHFAVEAEVAARGFLGLVAEGLGNGMTTGNTDAQSRAIERLVETVQAEAWSGAPVPDAEFVSLYHVTCAARDDTPLDLDAGAIGAIRARVAALTAEWQAIPHGGTLVLVLDH